MYLRGIFIAGEAFDYLASLDSSKGAKLKAVAYAEATFEYAVLRRSPSISETIRDRLRDAWGSNIYHERTMVLYALNSLDNPGKMRIKIRKGSEFPPITTVALAHLGTPPTAFPQTTYERIHYCGRALIDIEQRKDIPPFWKQIYAQVLTSYVQKLIKNEGLVKL